MNLGLPVIEQTHGKTRGPKSYVTRKVVKFSFVDVKRLEGKLVHAQIGEQDVSYSVNASDVIKQCKSHQVLKFQHSPRSKRRGILTLWLAILRNLRTCYQPRKRLRPFESIII